MHYYLLQLVSGAKKTQVPEARPIFQPGTSVPGHPKSSPKPLNAPETPHSYAHTWARLRGYAQAYTTQAH